MNDAPGFAVIDLETTGFGGTDRIIEVGVVLLDGEFHREGTWDTLVQPERDIPNSFVHKITATDVVHAPTFAQIARELAGVLQGRVPVAHNAGFEKRFLAQEFQRAGVESTVGAMEWVDTRVLARRHLGQAKLAAALSTAGIENSQPHAALADAEATAELLRVLVRDRGAGVPTASRVFSQPVGGNEAPLVSRRRAADESTHWLARLSQVLPAQGDSAVDRYRDALATCLVDRRLSASEIKHLSQIALGDGLSFDDIQAVHEEFLRQMAVEAWLDGVITSAERAELHDLAQQLGVPADLVDELVAAPVEGAPPVRFTLQPGDAVAFTGTLGLPRGEWERRVGELGLLYGGVSRRTAVVVAANPDSMSGKAARARELGIPVVDEASFARLLSDIEPLPRETIPVERFPWIAATGATDGEAIASTEHVAVLWIEHHTHVPLAQMSHFLDAGQPVDLRNSSIEKAGSVWQRRFPRMLEATVADLQDLPGVGAKRLRGLVEAVALAAIDTEGAAAESPEEPAELGDGGYLNDSIYLDTGSGGDEREREVRTVQGWAALTGAPYPGAPGDAIGCLFAACTGELTQVTADDPRSRAIAVQRWIGEATLDELGGQFGVTRERIRQLEVQLRGAFLSHSELSDATARQVARRLGPLTTRAAAEEDVPELFARDDELGCTYETYFRRLYGLWDVERDWLLRPGVGEDVEKRIGECSNAYGVFDPAEVAAQTGISAPVLVEWLLQGSGYLELAGGTRLARARSHQDRAAAILSLAGEPLTAEEIAERTGPNVNVRSMANQLAVDPRIVRVANNAYALEEWGMEEFSTITDWIGRRVDASGGQGVALADLLAEAPRLRISESSVRAYATGSGFALHDGVVTRTGNTGETIDDDPQDSKNLYWRDGAWHLLLEVNADHRRGSGFAVPRGVAGIYHVEVDGSVAVPSALGEQHVRVNRLKQPSTSTIRRFLEPMGAEAGDRVWLKFAPEEFGVTPAAPHDDALSGLAGLLSIMGLEPALADDPEGAMRAINVALGLDPDAPRRRAAAIFGHRLQDDLADVIRGL
ncbi:exonuclease domain-containing protein [Corynebacterium sp. UBA2622]|uniref:exonuclease domain-containing protein n=1 Tax=Corynebacterium sp. UBA2622 TaxID=1946393 RepID=UPI0025C10564|nr:exonuclease domain-containing protein [Corynebacterium sp. UBA2622]